MGERPDGALLDIRMPEMDGFATCERIRALPRGSKTSFSSISSTISSLQLQKERL